MWLTMTCLLSACGGGNGTLLGFGAGSNGGSGQTGGSGGGNVQNTVAVVVDAGPAGSTPAVVNSVFTSLRVCAPGSTSACQILDHVLVDSGSTGVRILAGALGSGLAVTTLPQAQAGNATLLDECAQLADGYSWGTVRQADVYIAGESATGIPVQIIGDPAAPPAPASCVNGPALQTAQSVGANAILGVGNFITDCGAACESTPIAGLYYGCASDGTCAPVMVSVNQQLPNPVALFAADNNGIILRLPAATTPTATLSGTLTFGIGTQPDNALTSAQIYTVDPNYGTLTTVYKGAVLDSSFIDSGINGYYFADATQPVCTDQPGLYCPNGTTPASATIQGTNGTMIDVAFAIDNADSDLAMNAAVLPNFAGPAISATTGTFAWGLPFFYGRSVFVAFEQQTTGGVPGPWIGF